LTALGEKTEKFYRRFGDRGIMSVLFIISVLLNTVFALRMSAPSVYPDEFNTAAWSAFFSGFGHGQGGTGVEIIAGGGTPWLTGAMYTPFYYLFKDPSVRYKCMLILNGLIVAFIPVLAYKITAALGHEKPWQKTLCAVVAGAGVSAFLHTKFIWSETLSVFLPFLLFWLFLKTIKIKHNVLRQIVSVFLALFCALSLAADVRMLIYAVMFLLTALYARHSGTKTVSAAGFSIAFVLGAAGVLHLGDFLKAAMTGEAVTFDLAFGIDITEILGALYYFAVSTWGIGVLGVCLCVLTIHKRQKNVLSVFAFFAVGVNILMIVFFPQGRHIDSAAPLLIIFTLCYVFACGLELRTLLHATIILGIIFALFFIFCTAENAQTTREVSATFCFTALLIVLVSCAERYRAHLISIGAALFILISCVLAAAVDLPDAITRAERDNREAYAVSQHIYNSADAPPAYVINAPRELTYALRFLNRDARIYTADDSTELPEDCFIITPDAAGNLAFVIRGDRAIAYARSQVE